MAVTLTMTFDEDLNLIDVQCEGKRLAPRDLKELGDTVTKIKVPLELLQTASGGTCIHTPDCRIRCF